MVVCARVGAVQWMGALTGLTQEHSCGTGEAEALRVMPGLVAWKVACGGHGWGGDILSSLGWASHWRQEQAAAPESGLGRGLGCGDRGLGLLCM